MRRSASFVDSLRRLACVHVGNVHLDKAVVIFQFYQRVAQRDGSMGKSAGVDHNGPPVVRRLVHPVDQLALVVGLAALHLQAELVATLT